MAKYSFEFTLKLVQGYLKEDGYKFICDKYSMPDKKELQKWVAVYNAFGADGLIRSRKINLTLLNLASCSRVVLNNRSFISGTSTRSRGKQPTDVK